MKKGHFAKALLIVFILLAAVLFVYTVCFKPVVLLEDDSFNLLYPKKAKADFALNLAKQGYSLLIVKLDNSVIKDRERLASSISKYASRKFVICSPVVSVSVYQKKLDLKELNPDTAFISLGTNGSKLFDINLMADESSVFTSCPENITAVETKDIREISYDDNPSYAVEYSYSGAVRKDYLKGVFAPDLSLSIIPLLTLEKENLPEKGILAYNYYEIQRSIF